MIRPVPGSSSTTNRSRAPASSGHGASPTDSAAAITWSIVAPPANPSAAAVTITTSTVTTCSATTTWGHRTSKYAFVRTPAARSDATSASRPVVPRATA